MGRIKFRAWDKKLKVMRQVQLMDWSHWWVSTGRAHERNNPSEYGERSSFQNQDTDRHILMQCTGLKDKNGKEIYEGDVLKAVAFSNDHHQRGAIVISPVEYWCGNACFSITYVPLYPFCVDHDIEIIGNVYENQ